MSKSPPAKPLRPTVNGVLCVIVWMFSAAGAVAHVTSGHPTDVARAIAMGPFAAYLGWILFWLPSVTVVLNGLKVRNILRSYDLTWPAIRGMELGFSRAVQAARGTITEYAAPAPPMRRTVGRTGAVARVGNDNGAVALHVTTYWKRQRDTDEFRNAVVDGSGITRRWLGVETAVLVVLAPFVALTIALVH